MTADTRRRGGDGHAYLDRVRHVIDTRGWTVHGVPCERAPHIGNHAYTVGLTRYKRPELAIVTVPAMPLDVMAAVLNLLAGRSLADAAGLDGTCPYRTRVAAPFGMGWALVRPMTDRDAARVLLIAHAVFEPDGVRPRGLLVLPAQRVSGRR